MRRNCLSVATNNAIHEAAHDRSTLAEGVSLGQYPAAVKVEESAALSAMGTAEAVEVRTLADF